ncbi:MAG: dephospho-CoA kinase [Rikenellaceae bacterium]
MYKIGVTGGIGSGKSTLCHLFKDLGIAVYNSDSKAKELMNGDLEIRTQIVEAFGSESYVSGSLNREFLAEKVFGNNDNIDLINSIVHPRVMADFENWALKQNSAYVILECAILFESAFDKCVDKTLCVLSPKPLRIERIISRDNLTIDQIEKRMEAQFSDDKIDKLSDFCVVNIDLEDLEEAAKVFDKRFRYESERINN